MHTLSLVLESCLGALVRRRSDFRVGPKTRVRWSRIGGRGGTVRIGSDSIIQGRISFDAPGKVTVGDRCYIGLSDIVCHSEVTLGNDVVISWGVTIVDHNSHSLDWSFRKHDVLNWTRGQKDWSDVKVAPVRIDDRVWIGFGATVLKGVTIGEGAVVGAGAVVTKDVAPYTAVAGNPARVVKTLGRPDEQL